MLPALLAGAAALLLGLGWLAHLIRTAPPEPEYGAADPNAVEPEGDGAWL